MIKWDIILLTLMILSMWSTSAAWPWSRKVNAKRTFILVGPSGVGKSTLGNCLFNRNASLNATQCHPFVAKDSVNNCTNKGIMAKNDIIAAINTVGLCDPHIDSRKSLKTFKKALSSVNNHIDGVLFVMSSGRLKPELVDFFRVFQEDVFLGEMSNNTMLICINCNKGWLQKNRVTNSYLNELINSCNNHSHEFKLSFDIFDLDLDQETKNIFLAANEESRNRSIQDLFAFIDRLPLSSIDLSHVQKKKFEKNFVGKIGRRLQDLNANITDALGPSIPIKSGSLVVKRISFGSFLMAIVVLVVVKGGGGGEVVPLEKTSEIVKAGPIVTNVPPASGSDGTSIVFSNPAVALKAGMAGLVGMALMTIMVKNPAIAGIVKLAEKARPAEVAKMAEIARKVVSSNPATKAAIAAFINALKSVKFPPFGK